MCSVRPEIPGDERMMFPVAQVRFNVPSSFTAYTSPS
jgi:hypothetical protein